MIIGVYKEVDLGPFTHHHVSISFPRLAFFHGIIINDSNFKERSPKNVR
jgi:hypothetical protein